MTFSYFTRSITNGTFTYHSVHEKIRINERGERRRKLSDHHVQLYETTTFGYIYIHIATPYLIVPTPRRIYSNNYNIPFRRV